MGVRFIYAMAMLGLAACDASRASSQASAPAPRAQVDAAGGTIHRVRSATAPFPRIGYCRAGTCSWFETREQQAVGSSERERLVRVTLASGRSAHSDNEFPVDAAAVPVDWARATEEAYVFCSRWRPSVMRRQGRGPWQVVRADLVRGEVDFEESIKALFALVCHPGEEWGGGHFFASRNYRPQTAPPVTAISHPQSIAFIHPNDPERPDMGGMAVSHSAPPEAVMVTLPSAPSTVIDARPPPQESGSTELVVANARGEIRRHLGTYPSLAACERDRSIRGHDHPGAVCSVGEGKVIR